MTSTNTTVETPESISAWIASARSYLETTMDKIKSDPAFLEWAATAMRPDRETPNGWIPGWNLDDCARKWFEHNMADGFPRYPAAVEWNQTITLGGFREFSVSLDGESRSIPGTKFSVRLTRAFFLSHDDDMQESIHDALAEPYMIVVSGDEELTTPESARMLAATLMDLADGLEGVTAG